MQSQDEEALELMPDRKEALELIPDRKDAMDVACDLEDLMQDWARSEAQVFKGGSKAGRGTNLTVMERYEAMEKIAWIARLTDSCEDIAAAQTLLDAYLALGDAKASQEPPSWELLAAVTRVAKKCSTYCRSDIARHLESLPVIQEPQLIAKLEAEILIRLQGRVLLASPQRWAAIIMRRLVVLHCHDEPRIQEAVQQSMQSINVLVARFTGSIAMSGDLPPSCLALGAIILGVVASGKMRAEDARPQDVPTQDFEASWLWKAGQEHAQRSSTISVKMVARAAGLQPEDLLHRSFKAVRALGQAWPSAPRQ